MTIILVHYSYLNAHAKLNLLGRAQPVIPPNKHNNLGSPGKIKLN